MSANDFPLPDLVCACASLRRASRVVSRLYDRALARAGLNVAQFTLLYVLNKKQDIPQTVLAEILAIDRTTLTRTLAPLERTGRIRVGTSDDGRERRWSITPTGRQALEKARPAWERVQERLRTRFGVARWDSMIDELTAIATAARMRPMDGVDRLRMRKTRPTPL